MKYLLYLVTMVMALSTTGCIIRDEHRGGYRDHGYYDHGEGHDWDHHDWDHHDEDGH